MNYSTVLETVHDWPAARRLSLLQDILRTLEPELQRRRPRRPTLEAALGLLATGRPAPPDAEIGRWLDEHRQEKYG